MLHYMTGTTVKERFWRFGGVSDKTAGLADAIKDAHIPLGITDKLIVQTYNGETVMSGCINGVQTLIKDFYPNAKFVHCCTHQLNPTLQQVFSARISDSNVSFADLSSFTSFFPIHQKKQPHQQRLQNGASQGLRALDGISKAEHRMLLFGRTAWISKTV